MQTVFLFSRCGAGSGNKKSPHNNLNLTIPSGMALVRVRYVAIRKSKTCSGSFGSRAGTLNKYVILNCWDRLPQKSSRVNKKFWKYDTFGSLQEKTMKTLAKRERAGRCQPSWQNYEMLKNLCCFYCGFQGPTGKTATKKPSQNRPALPSLFLEGHASRLCNGWKTKCSVPQGRNEYVKICYIQLLG